MALTQLYMSNNFRRLRFKSKFLSYFGLSCYFQNCAKAYLIVVPNSGSDWIISLVYFSQPVAHCVSRKESNARSAVMWRFHQHNRICRLFQDNYCLKSFLFCTCNMRQRWKLFHRVFINWWDFNPLKSNWKIQTQSLACCYRGLWFVKSYNEIFSHPDIQMVSGCGINNAWRASRRPKIDTLWSHVRVWI